jgi:hypothetical protein
LCDLLVRFGGTTLGCVFGEGERFTFIRGSFYFNRRACILVITEGLLSVTFAHNAKFNPMSVERFELWSRSNSIAFGTLYIQRWWLLFSIDCLALEWEMAFVLGVTTIFQTPEKTCVNYNSAQARPGDLVMCRNPSEALGSPETELGKTRH